MEKVVRDGKVAVAYWKPSPAKFKDYVFTVQHGVSMAWLTEEDAAYAVTIMEKHCKCAGGTKSSSFRYASQTVVNVYEKGRY